MIKTGYYPKHVEGSPFFYYTIVSQIGFSRNLNENTIFSRNK